MPIPPAAHYNRIYSIFAAAGWLPVHHAGPHPREIRVGRVSVQKVHVSKTLQNFGELRTLES